MNSIIEVKNLTKFYGQKGASFCALHDISFDIASGEFAAIMGPSGSGKTTLLNIISTIDRQTEGTVILNGIDIVSLKEKEISKLRRNEIGFVFQEFNLLNNMMVMDNIALPLTLNNVRADEIIHRVKELSVIFSIESQLDKYPYQLSGGQKQRAAVCRALVNNPKILFADEPTGALDSKAAADLLACFRNVRDEYGTTVVMVTHDASAASYCDRALFLKDGQINGKMESKGDSKEFFKRILHMVALLGGEGNECI